MDSSTSTVPLDEIPFSETKGAMDLTHTIIGLDYDGDDRLAPLSSRSQRAKSRRINYSYPECENIMIAVAANPRKRKRQNTDTLPFDPILVSICTAGSFL